MPKKKNIKGSANKFKAECQRKIEMSGSWAR
jgi:hypothetical protein